MPCVNARFLAMLLTSDIRVLRIFLKEVEEIAFQTWESQGNKITPDFLRGLLSFKLCGYIRTVHDLTAMEIRNWTQHSLSETDAKLALRHLDGKCSQELDLVQNRCEAKAIEAGGTRAAALQKRTQAGRREPSVAPSKPAMSSLRRNVDRISKEHRQRVEYENVLITRASGRSKAACLPM